jgi:4-diphosphocytidyl-2C-methyl-D-erythritol kinase
LFFVLLVDDSFVLFQLQGLLTTELYQDGLAALANKLVDDVPIEIAVVEGEEQGA